MTSQKGNNQLESESARLEAVYQERLQNKKNESEHFIANMVREREKVFTQIIRQFIKNPHTAVFLEIGAGTGTNLPFFKSLGFAPSNMHANELLKDRYQTLVATYPDMHTSCGNALEMDESNKYDVIFQSTVFTSILDSGLKQKLAQKMLKMLKPDGIILWYDFRFDNPRNKNVKGIKMSEIKQLFSGASVVRAHKVTLAPPIARRVGRAYGLFNAFPFLRTHIIAVIQIK